MDTSYSYADRTKIEGIIRLKNKNISLLALFNDYKQHIGLHKLICELTYFNRIKQHII